LRNDPYELKNVAEDPAYGEIVSTLDTRLMAELKATGGPPAPARSSIITAKVANQFPRKGVNET
jgi:hypothetical protein